MDAWHVIRGLAILIFLFLLNYVQHDQWTKNKDKEWMHGM